MKINGEQVQGEGLNIRVSERPRCEFYLLFGHSKSTQGYSLNNSEAEERKVHLMIAPC